ncbi:hypothetical protein [Salipaludibacillus sp. CF4.18]|uniref:hypothetical protein n=1 Tax=Salipaludibacillus sp. CF4.18 TaxID=3373081 RepID=UPI003EE554DC
MAKENNKPRYREEFGISEYTEKKMVEFFMRTAVPRILKEEKEKEESSKKTG